MTEKKAPAKTPAKAPAKKPAAKAKATEGSAPKSAPKKAPAKKAPVKAALPKPGDKVTWGTAQGETHGTVEKIVTEPVKVKGFQAKASKEHPEVMVKSDKSGKKAVHKPEELKKG